MGTRLALFDMDRTLLSKETASLYVRHQRDIGEATAVDLARTLGWVLQYTFGTLNMEKVAERVLRELAGMPEVAIALRCEDWFASHVERYLTDGGRLAVRAHQRAGDVCAIVTGASSYASRPLARLLGIEHVVSSEFEVDDQGCFTGLAVWPLCLGEGKLERAAAFAQGVGLPLDTAVFYTDSHSDLPLLLRVGEPVIVNPDPKLLAEAKRRGWPVKRWY